MANFINLWFLSSYLKRVLVFRENQFQFYCCHVNHDFLAFVATTYCFVRLYQLPIANKINEKPTMQVVCNLKAAKVDTGAEVDKVVEKST